MDPSYRIAVVQRELASCWWGGEAIPSSLQMEGWLICLGGTPHFDSQTIWFKKRQVDFSQPSPFRHDGNGIWMSKYRTLLLAMCREARSNDFMLGSPLILPAHDLLSMLMGTEDFMFALQDDPLWMQQAILSGAQDQYRVWQELQELMRTQGHEYWYGNAGWMRFWAPEPFISSQSDVSCMLSPAMYERFMMPELEILGQLHGALWYHLDGGDARQHLPRLLSLPYLRVVQYTPAPSEPPNGPAHLEMYRLIQQAGKIVHIQLPAENIKPLLRELDPAQLMLDTYCPTSDEGEQLLKSCVKWCRNTPAKKD